VWTGGLIRAVSGLISPHSRHRTPREPRHNNAANNRGGSGHIGVTSAGSDAAPIARGSSSAPKAITEHPSVREPLNGVQR
jgi:hypothetical protein